MDNQKQISFLRELKTILDKHKVTLCLSECQSNSYLEFDIKDHSSGNQLADTGNKIDIDSDYVMKTIRGLKK